MAWPSPPKTWVVDEVVTAPALNAQLRDALKALAPVGSLTFPGILFPGPIEAPASRLRFRGDTQVSPRCHPSVTPRASRRLAHRHRLLAQAVTSSLSLIPRQPRVPLLARAGSTPGRPRAPSRSAIACDVSSSAPLRAAQAA